MRKLGITTLALAFALGCSDDPVEPPAPAETPEGAKAGAEQVDSTEAKAPGEIAGLVPGPSFAVTPSGCTGVIDLTSPSTVPEVVCAASIWQWTDIKATGTGLFDSFVRLNANPAQIRGHNTDASPAYDEDDSWTSALRLDNVPQVLIGGELWREFRLDDNEPSATSLVTLDSLRIFTADRPDIIITTPWTTPTSTPASSLDLVWDLGPAWLLVDASLNSGSGSGDVFLYIMDSAIGDFPECQYDDGLGTDCDVWIYFFSAFGYTETQEGGFEEWSVRNLPFVSVSKTAETSLTRTWEWDITKSVNPDTWDLFTGDDGASEYTVAVDKTGFTDSDWAVNGVITIANPSDDDAIIASVADEITGGINATVDCGVAFPYTLPSGGTLTCTYASDLPNGDMRVNSATVTLEGASAYTGTADIDFGMPDIINEVNATINVDDTNGGSWMFSDAGSVTYDKTFACDADEGANTNTATIRETGQSDDATVTVNCYQLDVQKDAATSLTRTYDWMIDKSADQTELTLSPGQQFLVNYSVMVAVTGFTDSDWAVTGSIVINNPNPSLAATLTGVADVVSPAIAATVTCPSLTVPSGGTLTCDYSADLPDASTRTNTATATQQNFSYDAQGNGTAAGTTDYSSVPVDVDFTSPAVSEVDECIDVSDTNVGFLGTVCADAAPATFNYSYFIGPFTVADCGQLLVENTATFVTSDTGTTGSDNWIISVVVFCPSCTLTQGYWKTHSQLGPAPYDMEGWGALGDYDGTGGPEEEGEDLADVNGVVGTWYEVWWTPVSQRPWYSLAHQWMAAYLNIQNGADPSDLGNAMTKAEEWLWNNDSEVTRNELPNRDRNAVTRLIQKLTDFNEGRIGPGHCDEDGTSAP
jgi:hypothetical protein